MFKKLLEAASKALKRKKATGDALEDLISLRGLYRRTVDDPGNEAHYTATGRFVPEDKRLETDDELREPSNPALSRAAND